MLRLVGLRFSKSLTAARSSSSFVCVELADSFRTRLGLSSLHCLIDSFRGSFRVNRLIRTRGRLVFGWVNTLRRDGQAESSRLASKEEVDIEN